MKGQFAVLLFILAIFGFSGCSQPVGSISNSGSSSGEFSGFYIIAVKKEYYLSDPNESVFWRTDDHIKVIGNVDLNSSLLKIELEKDPVSIGPDVLEVVDPYEKFEFALPGKYILRGTYNGRTDVAKFEVKGSPTVTGDGSAGVGLEWFPEEP